MLFSTLQELSLMGDFGYVEYLFITIALKSTLTQSGSTR